MTVLDIKQRFGIIGSSSLLDRAIDIAKQVAPTDLTVLVNGESGSGKEVFPQIIHQLSTRKHGPYIAVNCGAIPEGTIDSELFGHEKGSFTGAHEARKGYFEMVGGGTIFLDEVAELPMSTQARLLRVLETGEFIKVGASKVLKTDVRIIAATNVNIPEAIRKGRFREDLYYRLNTVPIKVPSLRERKEDIHLLFRKFASDFATKYRMPTIKLVGAEQYLENYSWPGNVRQLKNIAEQISVIEKNRDISPEILVRYLPVESANTLPILVKGEKSDSDFSERDILYKVLFDMKKELDGVKKIVADIIQGKKITETDLTANAEHSAYNDSLSQENTSLQVHRPILSHQQPIHEIEESLSLEEKEKDFIKKALERHKGKRKNAAKELGISERTLYRKINEYKIPG
ncbi:MAG: sigma-54-dependent Fis family transcriptional regulator [Bacteroidetes bacterium]|nr:sigma-54-dependent Fis family transcriptional regulator [Bacteroidota bacterium]